MGLLFESTEIFFLPAIDAILIGHGQPVPVSPALQLSGSVRSLWGSGAGMSSLLALPRASPEPKGVHFLGEPPGFISPSRAPRWRPHTAASCECAEEPSAACLVLSEERPLVLGDGPRRTFSNGRGKAQYLIALANALCLARKPTFESGKVNATRGRKGPGPRVGEETPRHHLATQRAQGSRPQKLHPTLMAKDRAIGETERAGANPGN